VDLKIEDNVNPSVADLKAAIVPSKFTEVSFVQFSKAQSRIVTTEEGMAIDSSEEQSEKAP
jgi:hypothetical protein